MKFQVSSFTLALALLLAAAPAAAQKKPKPAVKEGDARKAVAAAPGFALNTGAVRVREVSVAGTVPVVVTAEVEIAVHFERASGGGWRAVEFRSGDRAWEAFDQLEEAAGAGRVRAARAVLEDAALEFEARLRERKALEEAAAKDAPAAAPADPKRKKTKEEKRREEEEKKRAEEARKIEVRRGPVVMKDFSPLYKSARGVVTVEADFILERSARGRWQVTGFRLAGESFTDLPRLLASLDAAKAARARADLQQLRAALEEYRRERGSYVVAEDGVALVDHLAPRHLKTVIRVDPWHRPYRYTGGREHFTLSSDGPDGKPSTPDDVTLAG